jgi:reversibly glycosylated polypeptide/UDP-arabinopyranose mutase
MYFPLMGEGQPYNRYDDIWCGWIFQKVFEHLRLYWSIGEPFIEHTRASDVFVNLVKEAKGYKMNETLWETINNINLSGTTPSECMSHIGNALLSNKDSYLSKLGEAINIWTKLCEKTTF